jgi:hypothetical protein
VVQLLKNVMIHKQNFNDLYDKHEPLSQIDEVLFTMEYMHHKPRQIRDHT